VQIGVITLVRLVLNTAGRMVYPFAAAFQAGMGVNLGSISFAVATANTTSALGPFLAPVADRYGRKFSMLFGLAIFTLGTVLVVVWPTFPAFVFTLITAFLGNAIFIPAAMAYLGDAVPYERRGLAVAATETSWAGSFMLGVPLVGFLIATSAWTAAFVALSVFGLASLALVWWLVPADQQKVAHGEPLVGHLRQVFTKRNAFILLGLGFFFVMANELVNMVFGVWMKDSYALDITALSGAAAVIGLSELLAEGLVAWLVDRVGKERMVAAGLLLNILTLLCLPLLARQVWGGMAWLFMFYLSFEVVMVAALPLVTEILPQARATMVATFITAVSLGRAAGSSLAPGLYAHGFTWNTIAAVALNVVALLFLFQVKLKPQPSTKSEQG
jgi:predicted MFS family arabinose efflux permease